MCYHNAVVELLSGWNDLDELYLRILQMSVLPTKVGTSAKTLTIDHQSQTESPSSCGEELALNKANIVRRTFPR
jgi:hypothetical protein